MKNIGFLIQFFPCLIISRLIQNKGRQTTCLTKNVFALIRLSSKDLQNKKQIADAKNRNDIE